MCKKLGESLRKSMASFKGNNLGGFQSLPDNGSKEEISCEITARKLRNPPGGRLDLDSSETEIVGSIPDGGKELCPRSSVLFCAV
jgi:hypothetical protein